MDFSQFHDAFQKEMSMKSEPSEHEKKLFQKSKRYVARIAHIPGIEMIAVGNSLSMYSTHTDSDIDLFIVTRPGYMWFVRVCVTSIFLIFGVWRRGNDIAENLCLSFFMTTDALALESIAIPNDIYLYYWIYYLKPIMVRGTLYEDFLEKNTWVNIPEKQKKENLQYAIILEARRPVLDRFWKMCDRIFHFFFFRKTQKQNERLGNPKGVILSDTILKFHVNDRREAIRDRLLSSFH